MVTERAVSWNRRGVCGVTVGLCEQQPSTINNIVFSGRPFHPLHGGLFMAISIPTGVAAVRWRTQRGLFRGILSSGWLVADQYIFALLVVLCPASGGDCPHPSSVISPRACVLQPGFILSANGSPLPALDLPLNYHPGIVPSPFAAFSP